MPRAVPQSSSGSPSITNTESSTVVAGAVSPTDANGEIQQPILRQREIGGRDGPEPTRFGDWEKGGRCIDF